jgi:hypothetical protein
MQTTRPEHELLLWVSRRTLDSSIAELIRKLVMEDLDWDYLFEMADRHGVIPLLHYHLSATCPDRIEREVMSRLREMNLENTRRSFFLTNELLKLMNLLEAEDIQAVPFKGPALAMCAYGDVGLRQFVDLDLLVHKPEVRAIRKLLVDRGFKPKFKLTTAQEEALLRYDYVYDFGLGEPSELWVEIHWGIVARYFCFDLDFDRLWDRLRPVAIGNRQLATLSPEDLLLILCVHGSRHLWNRLGWICDIGCLLESHADIDWQRLLTDATALGSRRMLSLGLLLASELLGTAIPDEVRQIAKTDRELRRLLDYLQEQLFAERKNRPGIFAKALLHLRMRERRSDRVKSFARFVANSTVYDWLFLPLPGWLFFLYYPLRPLRLAGKYGVRLLKGAEGREPSIDSR